MIRVAHVITGLGGGGAEAALARLVTALPGERFEQQVISLTDGGVYESVLRQRGATVETLGLGHIGALVQGSRRLRLRLERFRPALVQTWLCHADLIGSMAARGLAGVPVIWGVHEAAGAARSAWFTRAVRWTRNRVFGRDPARIVCCAAAARDACTAAGIDAARIVVIPNGVDTAVFRPDPVARERIRAGMSIATDAPVLAWASRWHQDKDPHNLFAALARLRERHPRLRVLMFGHGLDDANAALDRAVRDHGITDTVLRLGFRDDAAALFAASDLAVLASRTEALPNALVEAMACALPVVSTDVGDVRVLVADGGRIVPPADADALAAALDELLGAPATLAALGADNRRRALAHYGVDHMAAAYAALYDDVAGAG